MIKNVYDKYVLGSLLAVICAFMLWGCPADKPTVDTRNQPAIATNVEAPVKVLSPDEQKVADLQKKLDISDKKVVDATLKSDTIARLSAEKESLALKAQISEENAKIWQQNATAYKAQEADKDKEIEAAKIDAWRERLWIMAGIMGFLALVAGAVAWGFPLIRPVATRASAILGALAALMLILAKCLGVIAFVIDIAPYVLVFGLVVAVGYAVVALRHWWKDHNGLSQTVQGIEPIKEEFTNFGDHMLKYVDGSLVDHIRDYRKKLNQKVDDVKKVVTDDVKKVVDDVKPVVQPVINDVKPVVADVTKVVAQVEDVTKK